MPRFPFQQRDQHNQSVAPTPAPAGEGATALLKRYRPLGTRAQGGFGTVEIFLDPRLQRRVAIKRMPITSRYGETPTESVAEALSEARMASMLSHPNIVTVYDFQYDSAYAYLVMEYVDGMSLEEFLQRVDGHSLTYDETAAIADALIQALSFAHENGALHLDIKPANVLIDRNGHVKLTDFGMATLSRAAGFGGARGGTIGYMPPEQLNGEDVDQASDVFSLAAVLYEALLGEAPFKAATPAASLKLIKRGPQAPSELLPDIPPLTEEALMAALAPKSQDRIADIAEFGDAFMAQLGNIRNGRRSLARMIAQFTDDEATTQNEAYQSERPERKPFDPQEGILGSQYPHARRIFLGTLAGISVAIITFKLVDMIGVSSLMAQLISAFAVGITTYLAPQLGSALIIAGFLATVLSTTDIILAFLPVALLAALSISWWYIWGRISMASSAVVCTTVALAALTNNSTLFLPACAALAGVFCMPIPAVAASAVGGIMACLLCVAQSQAGTLTIQATVGALFAAPQLISLIVASAEALISAKLLERTWDSYKQTDKVNIPWMACAAVGIMSVLLLSVANPVENTSSGTYPFVVALGLAALYSIIPAMGIRLFGVRRETAEVHRS